MPRRKAEVKVKYGKAKVTPSKRQQPLASVTLAMRLPEPSSALARYVRDNAESGLSILELIEQFQEYDCDHKKEFPVMTGGGKTVYRCEECGRIRTVVKDA